VNKQECIVIFVRSPEKGAVKKRLAAVLDQDTVLHLYRQFVFDILRTVGPVPFGMRICFYPADAKSKVADWLGDEYIYMAQEGKDLGERLENAFLTTFAAGFHRVVIIGSDIPDLPAEIVEEAIGSLASNDAVIGPATDGGYYLIGFRAGRLLREAFAGVDWGTSTVFERTMDALSKHGFSVHLLPRWPDIDTYEDLAAFVRKHELTAEGRLLTLDYLRACREKLTVR
jgi:uncharacterized protein